MFASLFCKKHWPLVVCTVFILGLPSVLYRFEPSIEYICNPAVTPWLAPIVWDETFDPVLLDSIYEPHNITVAMTVFAVGKYTRFLRDFLETAEHHFFAGFNVHYYVFTDRPDEVPSIKIGAGRDLFVRTVQGSNRWQDEAYPGFNRNRATWPR